MNVRLLIFLACFFFTILVKAQYMPNFPQLINRSEYFNPGYYAIQHDATMHLNWGSHFSHFINPNKSFDGLLAGNLNYPVTEWNTTFGAAFLAEGYNSFSKINSSVHSGVKVQILKSSVLAMGLGMGLESIDEELIIDNYFGFKNRFYSSTGLVLMTNIFQIGASLHYTQLHKNGVFKSENFTYFINSKINIKIDEVTELMPAFIYRYHNGTSYFETGILASFYHLFNTGISYRFHQAIIMFAEIEIYKRIALGVGYYYNFNQYEYLSDGVFDLSIRLKLNSF